MRISLFQNAAENHVNSGAYCKWAIYIYMYTHVTKIILRDLGLRFQGLMAHDLGGRGLGTKALGSRCRAYFDTSFSCGMDA